MRKPQACCSATSGDFRYFIIDSCVVNEPRHNYKSSKTRLKQPCFAVTLDISDVDINNRKRCLRLLASRITPAMRFCRLSLVLGTRDCSTADRVGRPFLPRLANGSIRLPSDWPRAWRRRPSRHTTKLNELSTR
jgi:hypothetical protein